MKTFYKLKFLRHLIVVLVLFFSGVITGNDSAYADIYQPEGLNMPGAWNGWANPPTNLAIASYTQVTGGRVTKILTGTPRWQTIFSAAASGGDFTGGTYQWLFTSGGGNPWGNKWGDITVAMNTLQNYNYSGGAANNSITLTNGKWYTMNWKDNGYASTQAIFMETSAQPVNIQSVTVPLVATAGADISVTVSLSSVKSAEEIVYVRYSTDNWNTSFLVAADMTGTTGTAIIPQQADGTTVSCYAFSTTVATITANYDLYSIKINNNGGANYSFAVGAAPISWANLDSPATATVNPGNNADVHALVYIAGSTGQSTATPGVQAWIGYNSTNSNPGTWTNWVSASYEGASGTNDKYNGSIGASLSPGVYYYASRFQLNTGSYVYGGYSATGGGIWNGTSNVSGVLTVSGAPPAVTTGLVSAVTATTASVDGNVVSDGGGTVTARGICWSQSSSPTILDSHSENGTGTGSFTGSLTSLLPGTVYYARAYATNAYGTSYGDEVTLTTLFAVTFNVDMSTAQGFIPGTDVVYLAGGFPSAFWNEPGTNSAMLLSQVGATLQYSITLSLPAGTYEFKHFMNATWANGEWGGGSNRAVSVAGTMTVNSTWGGELNWYNLQSPAFGTILPSGVYDVTALAYIPNGKTGITGGAYGLQCWIGYNESNTDPSTWNNWVPASFNAISNSNDEYKAEIGTLINQAGTYYYASRFKLGNGSYVYGGYNNGSWDGTTNISGVLSVVNSMTFSVSTGLVSAINGTTATIGGNVLSDGGNEVTDRGICFSLSADPTIGDNVVHSGSGLGVFTADLTSLVPGTTYHARAFATNSTATVYGADIEFTTYYQVTFTIDMSTNASFVTGVDQVYLGGAFLDGYWSEPGTDPNRLFSSTPVPGSLATFTLQMFLPAGTYDYKHFINAGWAGGEWTGGVNRTLVLNSNTIVNSIWGGSISWANLQYPGSGSISSGDAYDVYSQVYIPNGITAADSATYGLHVWIGYSDADTDPSTWTNWIPADFSSQVSDNDEFKANLGAVLTTPGTYYYASRIQFGEGSYLYGGFSGGFWDGTTNISGVLTVLPGATKTCNLKLFIEGLYDVNTGLMKQAMDVGPLPKFAEGIADQVTIELHDATTPYAVAYTYSNADLHTDGTITINTIPGSISGSYYIVVKHRNSVETWSNSAIAFDSPGTISFDFTTDATKAYMSNLKLVGTAWVIFGGDATIDGVVDGSDMATIDNSSTALLQGYLAEDVNGDGIVDGTDMAMVDNNSTSVVQVQKPPIE